MMNKIITAILLVLSLMGCASLKTKKYSKLYEKESTYKVKETGQSPFVGTWDWVYDKPGVRNTRIFIGERNDSLMIGFHIVSNYGNWTYISLSDDNDCFIPDVSFFIPKEKNTINLAFCNECSKYDEPILDSIQIKLIDNKTLVWSTKKSELFGMPYQLVLKRENSENMKFSHIIEWVYKEVQK